jgi:predicted nucleotidyltransferase component of viral defense system
MEFLEAKKLQNFNLATIEMIAAIKVNALFLGAKYRDYYDLYFLAKQCIGLKDMFKISEHIVEG